MSEGTISWSGDVYPSSPTGFPILGGADLDNNGVSDYLFSGGNGIITDGINNTDPTGATGIGLKWNSQQIWRAYRSPQSVIVGKTGRGILSVGSGAKLRPCHLVIGEELGAYGEMTVLGAGTEFDNDWANIAPSDMVALRLARPGDGEPNWTWLYDTPNGNPFPHVSPAPPNNFNVWVGSRGTGSLTVATDAYFRVRHRLFVGGRETIDDAETYTWPYQLSGGEYLESVNPINSVGDLSTWADAEGGVLVVSENALVDVLGIAGGNEHEFDFEVAVGESTADVTFAESEAAAALPSVFGINTLTVLKGGTLRLGRGAEFRGVVVVEASQTPSRIIASNGAAKFEGVVIVRDGAKLLLSGSITNDGLIFEENGSVLSSVQTIGGTGLIWPCKCALTPVLLEAGAPKYVAALLGEWEG